ncbi:hypothetical protein SAMN05216388_102271 [Halorientalis persicus]|uniref:Uncharacterized protein n=1 Tax=Halorientalis persicus TaxID=1367881 RepID=A0A1H8THY3_9EURY|nr:hypothetical protein [Halorientalis persicus]SEO90411.1 hypothetical protein SAMN05216388_102271 [Halorientalis persicus]
MATGSDLATTVGRVARANDRLDITANLSVTIDGIDLAISTVDDRVRVQVPSVWDGVRLGRTERGRLGRLARILDEAGETAEIRVGDAVIAVVGADATPSRLDWALSMGPVEIRPRAVVPAVLRLR